MITKKTYRSLPTSRLIAACCITLLCTPAQAQEDAAFASAREAFAKGERAKLARAAASLTQHPQHPLAPWVDYFQLNQALSAQEGNGEGADAGMAAFITRHSGTYLAEKARLDWLKWLMKREAWDSARQVYAQLERPDAEAQCRSIEIGLRRGEPVMPVIDAARTQLAAITPLPEACRTPLAWLASQGSLTEDELWQRLSRQLALGKLKEARLLIDWLPSSTTSAAAPAWRALDTASEHPARYLAKLPEHFAQTRAGRELALFAVLRMARSDVRVAAARWADIETRYPATERGTGWGRLAYWAAMGHLPMAGDWYEQAAQLGGELDEEQRAWRIRAALREAAWPRVLTAIAALPEAQAGQAEWIYWQARAHAALGQAETAQTLFRRIAGAPTFYGTLASEALGQPAALPLRAAPVSDSELAAVTAQPALLRGLALMRNNMRIEGIREWNWVLSGMNDRQLLAAAELARRHEVIDRAINTADRTREQHDFQQRYPTPFLDQVAPRANAVGLDPAWVYGLMRQESRFITDAKSSVGAKGLMQLMPATAKWVAKKIGMSNFHPAKVTELDTNITLGTHYMKMVMDSLDNHPALASAAYNAGPGRARKWRAERPLEGAIYAETIPFSETRDYVKKVLANTVYYAALMGQATPSLTQTLGTVRPRGFVDGAQEDLP